MTLRIMIAVCLLLLALPVFAAEAPPPQGMTKIVVPAHDIARGDTISEADLAYQTVPLAQLRFGVVSLPEDLAGMEARRYLRAGEPVRAGDVRKPVLVAKGMTVTMTFDAPGISLTGIGRAMSEGGLGEAVTVLNTVSYRQIIATVTGPGTVRAEGVVPAGRPGPRVAAAAYRQ